MKLTFQPRGAFLLIAFLTSFFVSKFSFAQPTFFGSSSTPADNGAKAGPTAAVTPPASMVTNDLAIIYAEYRGIAGPTLSISTTGGQTWNTATTYSPGANQIIAVFWCTFNGVWGANPAVTISGGGTNGLTAVMYVFRPSNSNSVWGVNIVGANSNTNTATQTITGVTTTMPNTVTMGFWSVAATNTWGTLTGAGWSNAGLSAQYRNTTTGQSHTAAYYIQSTAGATGNVSQTQSVAATALRSIVSWNELSDNCNAATLLTESAACSNTPGTLLYAAPTAGVPGSCGDANSADVWYQFVATTSYPVITLSSIGANLNTAGIRIQLLSGSCGSWTSLACVTSSPLNTFTAVGGTGLTVGATYYVRIATNTNTGLLTSGTYGFNICVTEPNDLCANAITLTPGTSCTNITGNVYGATLSATTINAPNCAGSVVYDVWYKFVAQTTNPTITLSSIGSNFTNPAMELLSNNCGGSFTAYYCGTTSIAADFLTPGTTYFIRVYSSSGSAPVSSANAGFNICIVDPVSTVFNDECVNAINLPVGVNTCSNLPTTIAGATASAVAVAPCTGPVAYDVWYKFTATSVSSTITLSGSANNFTNRQLQIFSGTCGSLVSQACGTTTVTFVSVAGTTYYVRVYSTTGPAPNGNADFNICVNGGAGAPIRFGNSYVNVTKKTNGGVIQPGDILEIRMTVNNTSGVATNLRFVDNVPSKTTMLTSSTDSIRIITNEGLTYKKYTVAADADAATYKPTASLGVGEYNIRLNLGFASGAAPNAPANNTNSALSANGQMNSASDKPKGGGGMLFAIAYRVQVSGVAGDTVTLFPAQFIYNNGTTDITLTATPFKILISNPLNLCANSIGLNNAVENGGTFGSGTTLNRSTDLTTPIAGYTYVPNVSANIAVNDGRYGIVKNMSPRSDPIRTARRQPNCNVAPALSPTDQLNCNNRMFGGHWDIDGDHSGTNNSIGNIPPDATTPGGYMLEVNADYVASEVYRQTINNLCPNTYYEFSAWVRNICKTCGADSIGAQFTGSPTAPANGYPGVLPNLTFALNDLDYYNTGEIDTVGWLKKGFVFKTATGQTTATFSIRNNAQGGGGNDWTLDDIAIATCLPSMQYSPSINPMVCRGNQLEIYDTVRSYFDNYTNYKWERSIDGGNNWNDITTAVDTSLILNGSTYQFITKYTIPPANTTPANSNDLYRVVVATSSSNLLNASCLYTDASTIITLTVNDCGIPLAVDLLSFSGKINNGNAELLWVTSKENEPVSFSIEKSINGSDFNSIGTVKGYGSNNENNYYHFIDPASITGKVWYRIVMINKDGKKKYSRIISLEDKAIEFSFNNVVNPFTHELDFEILVPENSRVDATLISLSGKPVRKDSFTVYEGVNSLIISDIETLPTGMYILQVKYKDKIISKKLMKK